MSQLFGKRNREPPTDRTVGFQTLSFLTVTDAIPEKNKVILDYIIAHAKADERPYLAVSILGKKLLGLLDSGASRTIIGKDGWRMLESLCKLDTSQTTTCTVANGEICHSIGTICVPILLEDKVRIFNILVVPALPHTLILGLDFWQRMAIVPDLFNGQWTFSGNIKETQISAIQSAEFLTSEQHNALENVINDAFTRMGDGIGCTTLVEHIIRTDSPPIKQRAYPISPALLKQVDIELKEMLDAGIIEPSNSAWSSPIVMVKKKDGRYRFCVDFRKLNKVSQPDAYPIPWVSHTLDKLRDARYLTTLDIRSAYWTIPMAESSRQFTAFTIPNRGLFQFRRMPFGLHGAPGTWQRFLDTTLGVDLEKHVFTYLDDIIICTQTFEQHIEVLREVLKRLLNAGLTLNREKCHFCKSELRYLGYVVNEHGLLVDPDKIKAILDLNPPTNVAELRRVLGICGWYRRFLKNFSDVTAPLRALLHKGQKFIWTNECTKSFETIKDALVSAPILSCPNFDNPFVIQTDASSYGLGAVLSQSYEDGEKVISYISRSLTKQEQNYSTTERECLAVLFAIEKFRPYIEGTKFTIITDHYSLKWLNSIKDPIGRIARWAVRLQQYNFDIIHRKGKEHVVPDTLSRSVERVEQIDVTPDTWYVGLRRKIQDKPHHYPLWRLDDDSKLYKLLGPRYPELTPEADCWKLVIPKPQRDDIIKEFHDPPLRGHLGVYKTAARIMDKYYWPGLKSDVARYVRNCRVCLSTKPEQKKQIGHMLSLTPTVSQPWELISVDIVGPLPRSPRGHSYILVVADCFSKFTLLFPLRQATAPSIVKILEDHVILVFGSPKTIIADNGVQFRSKLFTELANTYSIKVAFTAKYHPQANPVERINRVIKTMLSAYTTDNHRDWDRHLAKVGYAIRSARHEVTGLTPNFINFGRELPISGSRGDAIDEHNIAIDRSTNFEARSRLLLKVFEDVKKRLKAAYKKSERIYNLRRREDKFHVGQQVWRRNHVLSNAAQHITAKLAPRYVGPLTIYRTLSPWTYQLIDDNNKDCGVWSAKDLKAHPPDD